MTLDSARTDIERYQNWEYADFARAVLIHMTLVMVDMMYGQEEADKLARDCGVRPLERR